jgi:hypothetical protein
MAIKLGTYVIVRASKAGVFAGTIASRKGQEVELTKARRIWYWDGAASLSQLAITGPSKPSQCKFPAPVGRVLLLEAIEIIPCTPAAKKSIEEVKIWKV